MKENRGSFTGKIGFVLAAAGSAVGLGNIWRFPYLAAEYGGGIFILVYIILAVTFGFSLMVAEIALGRKTGLSAVGAYKKLDKKFAFVGYLASIVPMIILPYYSVIGGWVLKYAKEFIVGNVDGTAGEHFFGDFTASTTSVGWFFLFMALTALVVLFGVEKGVEKVSKVMMPILIVLSIVIAIYSMTLDGAVEGLKYYLIPNFKDFKFTTVLAAMGQLFYSMSLAMGIMITYGSYMKKNVNIETSVKQIEIFDTGIAFLAGLMVIPAVFAMLGPESIGKGPGLMFVTLPNVFKAMPGGRFVGIAFFVMVFFAAITSSISLMETVVSIFCDKIKVNRKLMCLFVFIGSFVVGLPSCLGFGVLSHVTPLNMDFLTFFDFISNSVIMPVVAFLTCIFIGYVIKPQTLIEEVEGSGRFKAKKMFVVMIKYVAPIFILGILIFSVLEGVGIIKV